MSPKLPAVTARQVVRVAERLGFVLRRQRGSHALYRRDADGARLVIPAHKGDLPIGTLRGIIEDMGITPEQFRQFP
mgnify:CR=1 FL=1